ncbi:MAG: FtsX-like permease family protein [Acidobacteriota bacterium]
MSWSTRVALRGVRRHPVLAALAVVGVALGVAVTVAIDLANDTALRAFERATDAVMGRATHRIVGGPSGLPDALFTELIAAGYGGRAAPIVEATVELASPARGTWRLLGVDAFSEGPFRPYLAVGGSSRVDLAALLGRPATAVMAQGPAANHGLEIGSRLSLQRGDDQIEIEIIGLIEPRDEVQKQGLADLLLADIATAQEVLGRQGRLSRIDLNLEEAEVEALRSSLDPAYQLVSASAGRNSARAMTRGFRINLRALSLLALLCGIFLIYSTISFSVVRRRPQIGTLRALGVDRRQVLGLVLGEALVIALLGTVLGLCLALLLSNGLLALITRTLNDLYLRVTPTVDDWRAWPLARGALLGIVATLVAAGAPALEATRVPPRAARQRSLIESRYREASGRRILAALAAAALGAWLLGRSGDLEWAFAGFFAVVVAAALLTPSATLLLMASLRPLVGRAFGGLGRMAVGGVVNSLSRTAVAIAALVIAVAMTVGVATMINSFRTTLIDWLNVTLQSDFYLAPPGRSSVGFDASWIDEAAALPEVADVAGIRQVELPRAEGVDRLLVTDPGERGFELLPEFPDTAWDELAAGSVLVTEPFYRHRRIGRGATVTLATDRGPEAFTIAGVVYSYASDQGEVIMARPIFERFFDDRRRNGLAVRARRGADLAALEERLTTAFADRLDVQSQHSLRSASLVIFDRTFRITGVLRWLTGIVAFLGVLSALMALQLERQREIAILRATGLTPGQVWRLIAGETALTGFAAGLLSLPLGALLATLMVSVINLRSFGWSLRLDFSPQVFAEGLLLALVAAVLAGIYPALRMSRTPPVVGLREE